jgi:hypothetical protein
MKKLLLAVLLGTSTILIAQTPSAPAPQTDPLASLDFLLGTWSATTSAAGSSGGEAAGTYTFSRDLDGHVLQRTGTPAACKGPADFNCKHRDQLTIFPDANAQAIHHSSLLALFVDNEGHVIYYTLTTPDPQTVVFNSQSPASAPKFRLIYHLEGSGPKAVMSGKFQMAAPGSDDFHSYLEWSGTKLK